MNPALGCLGLHVLLFKPKPKDHKKDILHGKGKNQLWMFLERPEGALKVYQSFFRLPTRCFIEVNVESI